ncbi:chemoreceptor glutamine deamidase CheD [Reinekea sp.]|jgi:chemotaxis protein CheD|uniref:chemoreceptor glutamine deamidase CheD n=1 Tax=Reinekea sp. TaxID=1970455 RepID=UPI002A807A4D|nr:chemoreceptor glutamine deamidase CheD [Reinekea sp.]
MQSFKMDNNHLAPNRYYDRHFDLEAVKILPGEYFATRDNTLIVTVLGSCVSVCLRDAKLKIGGMNHFLLPNDSSANSDMLGDSARYGGYAMEILINHIIKLGGRRANLEAKIFGGGSVLPDITVIQVGQRNTAFVRAYLKTEDIPILAFDVLDNYPRKVYFFPTTGKVLVRKIKSIHNTTIMDRESAYRLRMRNTPQIGDVELFGD